MSLFLSRKTRLIILILLIILMIILSLLIPACCDKKHLDKCEEQTTSPTPNLVSFDTASNGIGGGSITGSCQVGSKNLPIYSVDKTSQESKCVSLSFDAAWGAEDTLTILDILDKYNIKTTFFMTGEWINNYPDMVREIYSRGHDLGNHSQNHKQMSKLSVDEQKTEIMSVYEKIEALTGYKSFLFRPPYGDYDSTLIDTVYSCNFYPIEWNVDSLDWKNYGVNNIIRTVTKHKALCSGSIILLHNGAKYTADALEEIIKDLLQQGFDIVPISDLIIRENFTMDNNGCQHPETN